MNVSILLPGMNSQFNWFKEFCDLTGKTILIVGEGSDTIAKYIQENFQAKVYFIVNDEEVLLANRLSLRYNKDINLRLMDFANTDFKNDFFDCVYAQASVSVKERRKIAKEFYRITKPGGIFCVGELVNLRKEIPQVIIDLWTRSSLAPLFHEEVIPVYEACKWKLSASKDFSSTLKSFYEKFESRAERNLPNLSEGEKKLHKKFIHKISHNANVYLKHGGDKFMGFSAMIFEKEPHEEK